MKDAVSDQKAIYRILKRILSKWRDGAGNPPEDLEKTILMHPHHFPSALRRSGIGEADLEKTRIITGRESTGMESGEAPTIGRSIPESADEEENGPRIDQAPDMEKTRLIHRSADDGPPVPLNRRSEPEK